jgi:WD40 repeat protein
VALNMAMKNLRDTLGDATEVPLFIETIPKRGYRFIAPVSRSEEKTQNGLAQPNGDSVSPLNNGTNGVQQIVPAPAGTRVRRLLVLAVVILPLGLASAVWYLHRPLSPLRVTGYTQTKLLAGTDGNRLYFKRISSVDSPGSIAQVAISGGEIAQIPVELPNPVLLDVSPDGSSFLIGSTPEGHYSPVSLWNVRVLGDSVRRLAEADSAAFSSDGNSVAYLAADSDNSVGIYRARRGRW